jgi:hypothetical protein
VAELLLEAEPGEEHAGLGEVEHRHEQRLETEACVRIGRRRQELRLAPPGVERAEAEGEKAFDELLRTEAREGLALGLRRHDLRVAAVVAGDGERGGGRLAGAVGLEVGEVVHGAGSGVRGEGARAAPFTR